MGRWKELLIVLAVVSLGAWWMQVEPPPPEPPAVTLEVQEPPMVPPEAEDWVRRPVEDDEQPTEFLFGREPDQTRLLLKLTSDAKGLSLQCLEVETGTPADISDLYFEDVHLLVEDAKGETKTIPLEMDLPRRGHWAVEHLALGNEVTSLQIEATPAKRQPPEVRIILEFYRPVRSNTVRVRP